MNVPLVVPRGPSGLALHDAGGRATLFALPRIAAEPPTVLPRALFHLRDILSPATGCVNIS
jgi:hypothetical protein